MTFLSVKEGIINNYRGTVSINQDFLENWNIRSLYNPLLTFFILYPVVELTAYVTFSPATVKLPEDITVRHRAQASVAHSEVNL